MNKQTHLKGSAAEVVLHQRLFLRAFTRNVRVGLGCDPEIPMCPRNNPPPLDAWPDSTFSCSVH